MRGGRRGHWSETWLLRYPSKRPHSPPLSPPSSFSSSEPTSLFSLNKIVIKLSMKILEDSSPPIYLELCLTNNTCLVSTIPSHPSVKLSSFKRLISGFPHSAPRWLFSRLCESHLSPIRWWWWGRQRCCSRALLLFTTRSCNKSAPDQSCPCAPPLIPTPTLLFDLKSEPWHKMGSSAKPQSAPYSFRTDLVREPF